MKSVRNSVVAGQFYSDSKESLTKELDSLVGVRSDKLDAIGIVSPHAGYMYSGAVAGSVFREIRIKKSYIIMGPNHTGLGKQFGMSSCRAWNTPLGDAEIDSDLASAIKKHCGLVKSDELSNIQEHSIEVQLPFLQYPGKPFKFVPIVISYADINTYRKIGKAIADSIRELKVEGNVTIIASSDMTHYEPQAEAKNKDSQAIDAILSLDEGKLVDRISEMGITMCGFAPTAIMIAAAKELGAKKAQLIKYATSGDVSGDYSSVVGYAGIIIS
ncbi:MAG: MEMO1 family protein [Candidatus Omnitrophota bacterium]|jgi:hypothetical protein